MVLASSDACASGGANHRHHSRVVVDPMVVSGVDGEVDDDTGDGLGRSGAGDAGGPGDISGVPGLKVEEAAGVLSGTGVSSGPGDSKGSVNPNKCCNCGSVS